MTIKSIFQLAWGIIILICSGCSDHSNKQEEFITSVTHNEYKEINTILNYKYGINENVRKKMLLSEISLHYAQEYAFTSDTDEVTPIIDFSYEGKHHNMEVYCIGRGDLWILEAMDVTNIELQGQYIVAYSLSGEDTLSKEAISRFGLKSNSPFGYCIHELSWYLFLNPDFHDYYIVKNIFSLEEAIEELEKNTTRTRKQLKFE